ncbi:hypothetical protein BC826DRAFT_431528 [Russula brevipes]|nr:hypothetical protein BC826DRAFT_431528 [Russula brevipes]
MMIGRGGARWGRTTSLRHSSIPIACVPSNSTIFQVQHGKARGGNAGAIPKLTHLELWWFSGSVTPVLPDSFLGGSALRLRTLKLCDIAVPALPNLLLSASDLVTLSISRLPDPEYISPASMVACLSSLSRLQTLSFGFPFQPPQSRDDQPSPPPQTRAVFPALTDLTFEGKTKYLDDFLARIDTPVLNKFSCH